MASSSINMHIPLARPQRTVTGRSPSTCYWQNEAGLRFSTITHRSVALCCAAQESSSTATVTENKEAEAEAEAEAEPVKAKPAAAVKAKKAPAKPLAQMMEEDVIPALKATLETEEALSEIELSFQDNRLSGSFVKDEVPYYFWAFFPDGVLTGPKGFSLSSHGARASTVEPFLIDEKKITAKQIVFWAEKRLAAQGILPVWKE